MRRMVAAGGMAGMCLALLSMAAPAWAIPCTTATGPCTEWVTMTGGRALVYRTHGLDARDERIVRAVIMIHGAGRNADGYFRTVLPLLFPKP